MTRQEAEALPFDTDVELFSIETIVAIFKETYRKEMPLDKLVQFNAATIEPHLYKTGFRSYTEGFAMLKLSRANGTEVWVNVDYVRSRRGE